MKWYAVWVCFKIMGVAGKEGRGKVDGGKDETRLAQS